MEIKLKSRWLNYGTMKSVNAPSVEPCAKLGLREKKTYGYQKRDEAKRQEFLEQIAKIEPDKIVYADEAGMDSRDDYAYGYNEEGEGFHALKSGKRQGRVNMIAAYCEQQLMAPFTIEGACNRIVFEIWIETCLIPCLKAGQWLVIDNATFHKGGRIEELIERAGCKVLYLPPYSPDFNKIERCWSWLKSRIRHCLKNFDCLRDAMEHILKVSS
jgi:transposase